VIPVGTMSLIAGLGGPTRHGCVALSDGRRIVGVCGQERATRIRGAGFNATGLPDEAFELLLDREKRSRRDTERFVIAEKRGGPGGADVVRIDHHLAHACASYLSSPFTSAVIVVCDRESPKVTIWSGSGAKVSRIKWPWSGIGFSDLYSSCARLFGFATEGGEQRFEALARLQPHSRDGRLERLFNTDHASLQVDPTWEACIAKWLSGGTESAPVPSTASCAAALQCRIGELFLSLLTEVRRVTNAECLCLAGSFFYHSAINTMVRSAGLFSRVFVPVDPGNGGLAVGAALHESGNEPELLSPFLGPAYDAEEIKAVLDNCKIRYSWVTDSQAIDTAVAALRQGQLVGWYEGRMEWGPRALGARSILANPFAPYVLENLNHFLKRREPWRGYAMSGLPTAVREHFSGPSDVPFMECDFIPCDTERFRHVLPSPNARLRIQTAGPTSPRRFRALLEAFGAQSGIPCLINTSFNGFHEPIVCTPRDAIRVFYGSGIDLLVLEQFIVTK
jgi:carbamoyltransferase